MKQDSFNFYRFSTNISTNNESSLEYRTYEQSPAKLSRFLLYYDRSRDCSAVTRSEFLSDYYKLKVKPDIFYQI